MSARSLGRVLISAWVLLSVTACGDDDAPSDAGPDGSTDAGMAGTGGNFIPRRDAAVIGPDPIRMCDLADPGGCPAGETCDVVVRQFAGEQDLSIYAGCVKTTAERAFGDPCDPEFSSTPPYQTPGLTDLVFRDQCGPDLVCGPDPDARGAGSCRLACHLGRAGETPIACSERSEYCTGPGPFQEYCRPTEGCDVLAQTGCNPGQNCFLRPTSRGDGFLGVCFTPAPMTVADGAPCMAYNECRAGSSCMGPLRLPLTSWEDTDYLCRPACDGHTDDGDAGIEDAGVDGTCSGSLSCSSFTQAGFDFPGVTKPPFGQCE